jgi:hypothetical protein
MTASSALQAGGVFASGSSADCQLICYGMKDGVYRLEVLCKGLHRKLVFFLLTATTVRVRLCELL